MPDPEKLRRVLDRAAQAFAETPGRTGRFTRLPAGVEVLVVGDMHGHVDNFRKVLLTADLANHPRRHLVLQELIHGPFAYPMGGDKSHQVLDMTAALKCQFPDRVHYLMGNHELAQWQHHAISRGDVDQNGLFVDGVREYYGDAALYLMPAYERMLASLDLALRTENRIFLSHTYPSIKHQIDWHLKDLETSEIGFDDVHLGGRVHSLVWDRDHRQATAEAFLQRVDADWVVTGHIPHEAGYALPNDRQIILDAKGPQAGMCLLPTDRALTREEFVACVQVR